jgi:hypothetical protein
VTPCSCIQFSDITEENIVSIFRKEEKAKQTSKKQKLRKATLATFFLNLLFAPEDGGNIFV